MALLWPLNGPKIGNINRWCAQNPKLQLVYLHRSQLALWVPEAVSVSPVFPCLLYSSQALALDAGSVDMADMSSLELEHQMCYVVVLNITNQEELVAWVIMLNLTSFSNSGVYVTNLQKLAMAYRRTYSLVIILIRDRDSWLGGDTNPEIISLLVTTLHFIS